MLKTATSWLNKAIATSVLVVMLAQTANAVELTTLQNFNRVSTIKPSANNALTFSRSNEVVNANTINNNAQVTELSKPIAETANTFDSSVGKTLVAATAPVLSNLYTNPSSFDPSKTSTSVCFTVASTVPVYISMDVMDGGYSVRNLFNNYLVNAGTDCSKQWDGKINGSYAQARPYQIRITATNAYGTTVLYANTTVLSTSTPSVTAPTITNYYTNPSSFNPSNGSTSVCYTLNGSASALVSIDVMNGSSVIRNLESSSSKNPGQYCSTQWDGRSGGSIVSSGSYSIRIAATNTYGSDTRYATTTVQSSNTTQAPTVTSLSVSPSSFNPSNGTANVCYTLSGSNSANISIDVLNGSSVIRNLESSTKTPGQYCSTQWDGRSGGSIVSNGNYTVRVTATNTYGSDVESSNVYIQNGGSTYNAPNVSNTYASPSTFNASSQTTSLYYTLDQTADITLQILSGSSVVYSASTASVSAGQHYSTWNGRNNSNSQLSDGSYTYKITATNSYGSDYETGSVTLSSSGNQNGAPNLSNDYVTPSTFNPNSDTAKFYFTLDNTANVKLEILDGSSTVYSTSNYSYGSGTNYISWNGRDNNNYSLSAKSYTYRLTASNSNGSSYRTGTVTLTNGSSTGNGPVISSIYANPNPFNPDDDGSTRIYYNLDTPAYVTVDVVDGSQQVRNLVNNVYQGSGTSSVSWNGENSYGDDVDNNYYTIRVKASNNNGTSEQTTSLKVDYDDNDDDNNDDLLDNVRVQDATFDPEDDERVKLYFDIEKNDTYITIEVLDGSKVIRTITDYSKYSSGSDYYVYWNGRDKDNDIVDDDTYKLRIKANRNGDTQTETKWVEVDTDGKIIGLPDDDDEDDDSDYGSLIDNISVQNDVFDPDDDEKSKVQFDVLKDDTDITVQIVEENSNTVVRTLKDDVNYDEEDDNTVSWDGEDKHGDTADDDIYRFKITAERNGDTETAYKYVEVDTDGHIIGFPNHNNNSSGYCAGYKDVPKNSPYCKAIELMNLRGIFQGYSDGTFRPSEPINRAEAVKVILLALGISSNTYSDNGYNQFSDTDNSAWYMQYVKTAVRLGIVNGYPDGTFKPEKTINRVELLKIFLQSALVNVPYCTSAPYVDTPYNSDTRWYMNYVCYAARNALVYSDGSGRFNPAAPMTRGDVADLFYQFETKGLKNNDNYRYYNSNYSSYNNNGYNSYYYNNYNNYNNSYNRTGYYN